jgi:ATP-dependent DNA ligase
MPSTFGFCTPTRSTNVPATPDWLHEIKYDGYRLRLERDGDRVRHVDLATLVATIDDVCS